MEEEQKKLKLPILLFDAECPLCTRFKDSISRLEDAKNITMVSIYEDSIYEQFPYLDKTMCRQDVHFITEDEKVLVGQEVLEHLITLYPMVKKFAWLIETNMGQKAVNYFHSMTNRYRKVLKRKCPSCTN